MPLDMRLWRVKGERLENITTSQLNKEKRLEDWILNDASLLGMDDMLIIGRQVQTGFGRIDLLALDSEANCIVLELKRDRTPREVVAQILEYATWVKDLGYDDLARIAQEFLKQDLQNAFKNAFDIPVPEDVNLNHSLVIVASALDESSERIIGYLSERSLNINAVFFNFFMDTGNEYLGRAWLKDPIEALERTESKKRAPWSGFWFVNVGEGEHRNWDDNLKYGYLAAGQGEKYSRALTRLKEGDKIFAYMKGRGYVGFGEVTKTAIPIKDFDVLGSSLLSLPLKTPHAADHKDSSELSEWVLGIKWLKTYPREEAKTFTGVFANQNIVCKLRDPKTLEFLRTEFGTQ
jgi:hypothetical protein